jgi:hypothetical protein
MNNILGAVLANINTTNIEITKIASAAFDRAAPFTQRNF